TDMARLTSGMEQLIESYRDLPLRSIPFAAAVTQTFDLFRSNYVRPPSQFTLMLKTMVTIEAFAKSLDPDFNLIEALTPFARRASMRDFEPKRLRRHLRQAVQDLGALASRLPEDVNVILNKFRLGKFQVRVQHEHLEALTKTLDRSSNRISFALIIAALLIGSSMLVAQANLQRMGVVGYMIAAVFGMWLLISIIRGGKL
ncbi:MAG: hypothetical protein ABFE01_18525, partial [Phycisphaerales bacterium]